MPHHRCAKTFNKRNRGIRGEIILNKCTRDKIYNISVLILAFASIILTILDITKDILKTPLYYWLDLIILIFFWIDYIVRLICSDKKMPFIKDNVFDLLAILPFSSMFSMFRIFRIFRVMRIMRFTKFLKLLRIVGLGSKFKTFLYTNGFIYVLYLNIVTTLLGAIGIYLTENGQTVNSFGDAVWWAFITSTTVGYGDISPVTPSGRIIAGVLMLVGISCIGMLTGTIATYFTAKTTQNFSTEGLTEEELRKVNDFIKTLKGR